MPRYWLLKSEPDVFAIQHLAKAPRKTTFWDGIRNYQARNFLRDEIKKGDGVLFYHSNADPPAVAGTAVVVKEATPDPSQFDAASDKYDAGAKESDPRWFGIEIQLDEIFPRVVPLDEIKATPALAKMVLVQRSRLSVQPVTEEEWKVILKMGRREG
jgi:predicted RNA-binding protein with PUA-like domain